MMALSVIACSVSANAHEMTYAPLAKPNDDTTSAGVIGFNVLNKFESKTRFQIEVLDENKTPIADDAWRTNVEDDIIELEPGSARHWYLQVKFPGKYLACTRRVGSGIVTRVCATLNRRF